MNLIFTPGPDSTWRVISADDPQPEGSWSPQAPDKRIAPAVAPTPAGVPPVAVEQTAAPAPRSGANEPPSEPTPAGTGHSEFLASLPRGSCPNCLDRPLLVETRRQANYYRSLFRSAKQREADKDARIAFLEAEVRMLNQRLFGSKSESHPTADQPNTAIPQDSLAENASPAEDATPSATAAKQRRKRGQQKGNPIPKRRDYSHLPVLTEEHVLPEGTARCSCCGKSFAPAGYEEDSELIEVEVKAYRRRIRRKRYFRTCSCPGLPTVLAAPVVPRVLPHSPLGISVWVQILLDKYNYCRSTHKQLDDLRSHGLSLASGTVTGGLKRLAGLFEPIYQKLIERNRMAVLWGADETRWRVFQVVVGKVGNRWYVWLFESADCVVFTLDKGRAHDVPENHFGETVCGIVVVDRYSAYKAMKHVKEGRLRLAFCWAHQRRDFLDVEKSWPKLNAWSLTWLAAIGDLYQLNKQRLQEEVSSEPFEQNDAKLRQALEGMRQRTEAELQDKDLHPAKKKVLLSLREHWEGLTLFADNPQVPMDNNRSERTLRIAALCRKNYYGSGSEWSGKLAVWMFSILGTLKKHGLNPRKWLSAYLQACARAGGKVPADVENWLPWNLSAQQKKEMAEQQDEPEEANAAAE